jgi:hypothetical protein
MLKREIVPGTMIPAGWRMAWFDPMRHVGVFFPVPLHWLARAARELRWRVALALSSPGMDARRVLEAQRSYRQRMKFADEYARGYLEGWRECFEACAESFEGQGDPAQPWSQ